jgi:hypothetical protein
MSMNAIDQDLASAYERHGGRLKAWKHLGKKTAGSVKDAVKKGGKAVGNYFTEKLKGKKQADRKQIKLTADVIKDPINITTASSTRTKK